MECPVCRTRYRHVGPSRPVALACGHDFCRACILHPLVAERCPTCISPFSKAQVARQCHVTRLVPDDADADGPSPELVRDMLILCGQVSPTSDVHEALRAMSDARARALRADVEGERPPHRHSLLVALDAGAVALDPGVAWVRAHDPGWASCLVDDAARTARHRHVPDGAGAGADLADAIRVAGVRENHHLFRWLATQGLAVVRDFVDAGYPVHDILVACLDMGMSSLFCLVWDLQPRGRPPAPPPSSAPRSATD